MTRFSAATLDLSRFPPPFAIKALDLDTVLAERLARLKSLFAAEGIDWDVDQLVGNPAAILERADSYRELLVRAALNDAVRAVMVAFAIGSDLEHLAAFYGLSRRVITPAQNGQPAVMESDAELRRRALLAPEAFAAAGPHGAYVFHALNADPRVLNADVWSPAPGEVQVAIQSREGDGSASAELVDAVRRHLNRDDIKPITDMVSVRSVTNHPFSISLDAYVQPGPDPVAVKAEIEEAILKAVADRRTPSRDMPRSAIIGAAQRSMVDRVTLVSPAVDLARGNGEVAVLQAMDVRVTTHDG
ncbi:baseplate assembly protein [Devosia pacifica]|uniref:Baseplate assembly protein n=1 Tax=Devosia pacifica TaxID=1335967 RepID=A0A918VQ18_9HYPH|nr:baseplate J/gp47 family protein [Devosia pacifica]GHA13353.1 baseplate assembly protein [Devosia pacifica]